MNPFLKFRVEVADVFNNFAAAVFIVVVVDDDEDGANNDDNDVDDDHVDEDDGIEDDAMSVAKLCCSVETLITNFEFLAYDGVGHGISCIRVT